MRLPDFIIGGSPRCGTTWLYRMLERHPEVGMAQPAVPEPKFFHIDDLYARGIQYYSDTWFAPLTKRVRGEKTSSCLENPLAAVRIRESLPRVRLIFSLREPASRAYSNYLRSKMNGFDTLDFADALAEEERRQANLPPELRFVRPYAYFSRGLYADLLKPFYAHFPAERLLVLRFEDITEQPGEVARRVQRFLKVAERPEDGARLGRINASPEDKERPESVIAELRRRYVEPNRRLAEMLGKEFWPQQDASKNPSI